MKNSVKATLIAIAVAIVLLIAGVVFAISQQQPTAPAEGGEPKPTVRTDSHVLDDGGEGAVTVVEFLDFECEACAAFYPVVEDLREKYDGEITYVVRYFPLPGHINSTQAALAAEAAGQQDRFNIAFKHGCHFADRFSNIIPESLENHLCLLISGEHSVFNIESRICAHVRNKSAGL